MAEPRRYAFVTDVVPAPGETVREVLDDIAMTQSDLAVRLGRTEKMVSQLVNGKAPITPETAIDLERVLGVPASFWNNAESKFRDWLARRYEESELESMVSWAKLFPVKSMVEFGWIPASRDPIEKARALLAFFGVASSESWGEYWGSPVRLRFRMSPAFKADVAALTAWLRQGEIEAQTVDTGQFDRKLFMKVLARLRGFTAEAPEVYVPEMKRQSATAGVAVVFVRELPGTRCSGATHWPTSGKAVIQLCLRYKTDDQLWFSFFHEAGHVLHHGKMKTIAETYDPSDELEEEAHTFARDMLIPHEAYSAFVEEARFTDKSIVAFAAEIGIAPSIVVGRLQHEHRVGFDRFNKLKTRLKWAEEAAR